MESAFHQVLCFHCSTYLISFRFYHCNNIAYPGNILILKTNIYMFYSHNVTILKRGFTRNKFSFKCLKKLYQLVDSLKLYFKHCYNFWEFWLSLYLLVSFKVWVRNQNHYIYWIGYRLCFTRNNWIEF